MAPGVRFDESWITLKLDVKYKTTHVTLLHNWRPRIGFLTDCVGHSDNVCKISITIFTPKHSHFIEFFWVPQVFFENGLIV